MSATTTSPRGLTVILSVIGAYIGFALVTVLLQMGAGGKAADPTSEERIKKKEAVAAEQAALVQKYGLNSNAETLFAKVSDQIKTRKVSTSTAVVAGTPTALKQAAASAPATPAPAGPTPAGPTPAAVSPAPAVPAAPAEKPDAPKPATPPPATAAPTPPPAAAAPPAAAPTNPPIVNPAPPADSK